MAFPVFLRTLRSRAISSAARLFFPLALAALCLGAQGQRPAPATHRPAQHAAPEAVRAQLVANLRAHIHHVFVIYQENRSFDSYFGTYPGADNLATVEARAHGFRQYDAIGKTWVTPFPLQAADTRDANHSRHALLAKTDGGRMDRFVSYEEEHLANAAGFSPAAARELAILTMAHEDCNTIPFLWMYAHRFTLYDHIFQAMYGPSTPGNIDLIAGQSGQTQAARHPDEAIKSAHGTGEPVVMDADPKFGPYAFADDQQGTHQIDQTYATLMLTLKGGKAPAEVKKDTDDIQEDIGELGHLNRQAIPWAWYQEGLGDGKTNEDHPAYIAHHNAPQYFGYIRQNPAMWSGEHDLMQFFGDIEAQRLPERSVVFIKGGSLNPFGWKPADPRARAILGDDDHPGYSDSQLSEALVAKVIDTVARSPYWKDAAIIILWDDSEGFYDHVPPPQFEQCPDKEPCGDGPRVPLLLISPYAKSGGVVSDAGDHVSFDKFVDLLFDLPPLASLPDEKPYLPQGPRDTSPRLTDLLGGFDPARLAGHQAPIPAAQAEIPDAVVNTFPPPMSCKDAGVVPVAVPGASLIPPKGWTNVLP